MERSRPEGVDPRRLRILHATAEAGGIAAAARTLGLTSSAVSQQLARLEREAGLPLLDRTGGRAELTAAGRLLAASGARIGEELAQVERELAALSTRATGPVVIGAPPAVIADVGVSAVRLLAHTHPGLRPALVESGPRDGLHGLRLGALDVLVLADDRDQPVPLPAGVGAMLLLEDEYRLVVPDAWETPAHPADLAGRPWVDAPPDSARGRALARFAALHGLVTGGGHQAHSNLSVQALVAGGLGAAILPAFTAGRLLHATVTGIPVPGQYLLRALHHGSRPTPAVRATLAALQHALLVAADAAARDGWLRRDPVVRRLTDPSEE